MIQRGSDIKFTNLWNLPLYILLLLHYLRIHKKTRNCLKYRKKHLKESKIYQDVGHTVDVKTDY
jgi:hypothetical protein